jgi:hypothetical protein
MLDCNRRFARTRVRVVASVGALGLLLTACAGAGFSAPSTSTTVDPNGSSRAGYYDTAWPSEHTDRWRTHAVVGGLPGGVESADLVAMPVALPATPAWGYTRDRDEIYVIGGSPFLLGAFTAVIAAGQPSGGPNAQQLLEQAVVAARSTPYVAKIDPATMKAETVNLTLGSTVNYTGGLLMHRNGSVYAVARSVLYKLTAEDLSIQASVPLPLLLKDGEPNNFTTYNGLQVTSNGDLVLKGVDITGQSPAGKLLLVDPDTLQITAQIDSDALASARLTLATDGQDEYLYHTNATDSIRFKITPTGIELDDTWTASYRAADSPSTQASSPLYLGRSNAVVFSDNTVPFGVSTPMRLFTQPTAGGATLLQGQQAFKSATPQANFFMVAADPFRSQVVVVEDQLNGLVAGWKASDDGTLSPLWETGDYRVSAGAAIGYEQGHLYIDDRRCDPAGKDCKLFLVVLELTTGKKLAEVEVAGTEPSIGQIFVGHDAVYLIASEAGKGQGLLTRVSAR